MTCLTCSGMWRGRIREARGTALVELALVLPLLLVLMLGMLDFGKAFNEWIDETHLANEGARLAAVGYLAAGCTSTTNPNVCIAQQIQQGADLAELSSGRTASSYADAQGAAQVCISYPTYPATSSHGQVGDPVQVTVTATYHWLKYLMNRVNLGTTDIEGKATMRLERRATDTAAATTTCYPA
jgi:Flp pilus assembly protein TadG